MLKFIDIDIISNDENGNQSNLNSFAPDFSDDATKAVFVSGGTIFLKDLETGKLTEIIKENGGSSKPSLSPNSDLVVFESYANNIVPNDSNHAMDIFVKNLETETIERISVDNNENEGNSHSTNPVFSPTKNEVVFHTIASNLISELNSTGQLLLKNLDDDSISLISSDKDGNPADSHAFSPVFYPDGKSIAFLSAASNLVPNDDNGKVDVFKKNLITGETTKLSTDSFGKDSVLHIDSTVYSPASNYIAYATQNRTLIDEPLDYGPYLYAHNIFTENLTTGNISLVSADKDGNPGIIESLFPSFSPDGTKVIFSSLAPNLAPGDDGELFDDLIPYDIFIKDIVTQEIKRVDIEVNGELKNVNGVYPKFIDGGNKITFVSSASNYVDGNLNNDFIFKQNIFILTLAEEKTGTENSETIIGTNAYDIIHGLMGNDNLSGRIGDDTLNGGEGSDVLNGEADDDFLNGEAGWDWLKGGVGNDTLFGGGQSDGLIGGTGNDIFFYDAFSDSLNKLGSRDTIHDFMQGEDKLDFSSFNTSISLIGDAEFSGGGNAQARQYIEGSKTILSFDIDADGLEDMAVAFKSTSIVFTDDDFI